MFELTNLEIKWIAPERVYVFPERLTKDEIGVKVNKLHTIANEEADRTIYCLFDELVMNQTLKFEVCFPVNHLDLKKYKKEDFKVIQREQVVSCEFSGEFTELSNSIEKLTSYAAENGYDVKPPYRYLFILHKKPLFSNQPPKFKMEVQIPVVEKSD